MSKYELNDTITYDRKTFKVVIGNCNDCVFHKCSQTSSFGCGYYAQYSAGINTGPGGCRRNYIVPNGCCFEKMNNYYLNQWKDICSKGF